VQFKSDGRGYRARPEPPRTADPYRMAFVGDSFTEAKQVEYDQTFVALLERRIAARLDGREVVAENYGIAGTGFFDYWHRIIHDVFRADIPPPAALVLCIYPNNDFIDYCPDSGFDPDGRPRREFFGAPSITRHVITWLNIKSKFAYFAILSLGLQGSFGRPLQRNAPPGWWSDPVLAATLEEVHDVRKVRALMQAIELECLQHETRLGIVIVGPAPGYALRDGSSPLAQIFRAWGIKAPVIDVAARASAAQRPSRLVFRVDGHLNPEGHRFCADAVLEPLSQALGLPSSATACRDVHRVQGVPR
jgi:hypothetical protein